MRSRSHLITLAVLVCSAIAVALPASAGAATNGPILRALMARDQTAHVGQPARERAPALLPGLEEDLLMRQEQATCPRLLVEHRREQLLGGGLTLGSQQRGIALHEAGEEDGARDQDHRHGKHQRQAPR